MDGRGWAAGLRKMETGTKAAGARMASGMAGAIGGVFAVGAIIAGTRRMIDHADAIDKMAKRMEVSTDTAQKFDFAASQNGATIENVERSYMKTASAMEGAKQGLQTYIRAFAAFGITIQQIKTSSPEEIFLHIAESIRQAGGALDNAKSLQDIMGRGGRQLTPAFVSGFASTAGSAPDPIEAETIKRLATFKDEMDRLTRTVLPAAANAVATLANAWESFFSNISVDNFFQNILDFVAPKKGSSGPSNDVSQREWDVIGAEFGKPLPRPMSPKQMLKNKAANEAARAAATKAAADEEAAEAAAARAANTSWSKPSLQLNSLQRIGAAVSQSTDPVAIEKDNNKLLKTIAKNTKQTANNTDDDF
jgi:hypothetical protein